MPSLKPAGSNPIIEVIFDSPDYMSCTLFLKNRTAGSDFQQIFTPFNNKTANTHLFTFDPTKAPISGSDLNDLIGCELGWVVSVFDFGPPKITFSFSLDIKQSGISILATPIVTTEASSNVTISSSGKNAIFNETLVIQ
jgi:hypothetical protein